MQLEVLCVRVAVPLPQSVAVVELLAQSEALALTTTSLLALPHMLAVQDATERETRPRGEADCPAEALPVPEAREGEAVGARD